MFKDILISTRFGNLLIIAASLAFAFFKFAPTEKTVEQVSIYIALTVAVAFAGYILNDYRDQQIDAVNKPGQNMFNRPFFKKYGLFIALILMGSSIAYSWYLHSALGFLFTFNALLLVAYAWFFKKMPVVGNVVIAYLQASVFLVMPIASTASLSYFIEIETVQQGFYIFVAAMGFLLGWIREWIKDVEDQEGDEEGGAVTIAVWKSGKFNKNAMMVLESLLVFLVAGMTIVFFLEQYGNNVLSYYYLFLMLPISVRLLLNTQRAEEKEDWTKLSQWAKIIMFAGIMSLGIN